LEEFLEILEPVGSATDVEDNTAMEKSVEDRGGHCLVAGEDPGPFLDRLVGGDGGAGAAVAIADQAEEEGGTGRGEAEQALPSADNPQPFKAQFTLRKHDHPLMRPFFPLRRMTKPSIPSTHPSLKRRLPWH